MDDQYWCDVCNYIYLPFKGDPSQDVPPGTDFDDLPEDWHCPVCYNEKKNFLCGIF